MPNHVLRTKAESFYSRLLAGDLDAVLALVAEDVVLSNPMPADVPFGGTYQGREGVLRYFGEVLSHLELKLQIDEIVTEGDSVVVFGCEYGVAKSSGRHYRANWAHHLRFSPCGLIGEFRAYTLAAEISEAFARTPVALTIASDRS